MTITEDNDSVLYDQNSYKYIKLYTPLSLDSIRGGDSTADSNDEKTRVVKKNYPYKSFKHCISFNTVPIGNSKAEKIDKQYDTDFPGVQFPTDYTMEEYYDNESGYISDNSDYSLHNQYLLNNLISSSTHGSRSNSPTRTPSRSLSPPKDTSNSFEPVKTKSHKAIQLTDMFKIAENGKIVREDYPTRPTLNNDSIAFNTTSSDWNKLWTLRRLQIDNRVFNKTQYFKYSQILFQAKKAKSAKTTIMSDGFTPLTTRQKRTAKVLNEVVGFPNNPRTILCHIDGRRHTWVALDWLLTECVQTPDHIIVYTNLPSLTIKHKQKHHSHQMHSTHRPSLNRMSSGNGRSESEFSYITENTDPTDSEANENQEKIWYSGYNVDKIRNIARSIQTYVETLLLINKPEKSIKLTIEISVGKTVDILCDMINIYMPDIIVSSNLNVENSVKWKSSFLSDLLCTAFPIPVIVVPSLLMNDFEKSIETNLKDIALNTVMVEEDCIIPPKRGELVNQLDAITLTSLQRSIKMNKFTAHQKTKQMVDVAFDVPEKKKTTSSSHDYLNLRQVKTVDPNRLKPTKSNSYTVGSHSSSADPLVKSKSAERIPLRNVQSNAEVSRRHLSPTQSASSMSSSSSSSSSKGFFSSLFKNKDNSSYDGSSISGRLEGKAPKEKKKSRLFGLSRI